MQTDTCNRMDKVASFSSNNIYKNKFTNNLAFYEISPEVKVFL